MSKDKLKWLKMRKKTDPEYPYEPPIWLGPLSNGEFYRRRRSERLKRVDVPVSLRRAANQLV